MKCVECERKATYDAPEDYCTLHWAAWWAGGATDSEKDWFEDIRNIFALNGEEYDFDSPEIRLLSKTRPSRGKSNAC